MRIDTDKINKTELKKAIALLRSGNYPKGKDSLKSDGCYCVLGVLAEASDLGYWTVNNQGQTRYQIKPNNWAFPEEYADVELSVSLQKHYGFECTNPEVYLNGSIIDLATLNDDGYQRSPYSFSDIADLLEITYLGNETQ